MTDSDVEAALFRDSGRNKAACRAAIDYAHVYHELHKSTATLHLLWSEYQEGVSARGGGVQPYGHSQFCELYGTWRVRIKPSMRRVHRAHLLKLDGPSIRRNKALQTQTQPA